MGLSSFSHLLIILVVVLLVFGPGRLSKVMGEFGKGVRSLRDGMQSGATNPDEMSETELRKLMQNPKTPMEDIQRAMDALEKKKNTSES